MSKARHRVTAALLLAALQAAGASSARWSAAGSSAAAEAGWRIEQEGIAVAVTVEPLGGGGPGLREGEDVLFRFAIADTTTGTPLTGLYPAAWMTLLGDGEGSDPAGCVERVEEYVGGSILEQAELDLNVYYVVALNHDPSLTVVDPLFGFGGTKLLALVDLPSPGEDWALGNDRSRIFVSLPASGQVAVVGTGDWRLHELVEVGPRPERVALQGDGAFLWVGTASALVALDTSAPSLRVAARIELGAGPHDIAFSDDDRLAFVTSRAAGTVSVIDVPGLGRQAVLDTGPAPVSVAYSALAGAAYVTDAVDGTIAVLGGRPPRILARIASKPGLGQIRFAPGGRLGFAVNTRADVVDIIDAALGRVVQTGAVKAGPFQVSFSDQLAYVAHLDSEQILMFPLDEVGEVGANVPVIDFPGGQQPFGRAAPPGPAPAIVRAPGATAVLVANPGDQMIYYYKEGMAAPMGGFRNYDRQPRAVMVVDRSLRERSAVGVYQTAAKLRRPGRYEIAFFLDTPRIVHCFTAEVAADPRREAARRASLPAVVEALEMPRAAAAGEPVQLRFRLRDAATGAPQEGLRDVRVMVRSTANWHQRKWASAAGGGVYQATFALPAAGTYVMAVECRSRRLLFHQSPQVAFEVVDGGQQAAPSRH